MLASEKKQKNPLPRRSCRAPAAPAVVGPLTQFKQRGLEHPTAVNVEGASQTNRILRRSGGPGSVSALATAVFKRQKPPFPSLERADSGARRRGKKTERCEHCEREYSHDSGSTYSLHSPLTGTDSLLCPDHLAQHPERRQQEVGLITFFSSPARQHRWSARQID